MEVSLASSYVPEYLKMKNRRMIFDAFRKRKLLSRAELASELAMSFPTVCKTIDFLISKDIIRDTGQQDNTSGPGRKRKLLEFNSESYCVFSLGFEGTLVEMAYVDLCGNLLSYERQEFSDFLDVDAKIRLGKKFHEMIADPPARMLGIGVAFPSVVNPETREIESYFTLGLDKPIQFDSMFSAFFDGLDYPMYVGNDVNMAAKGELVSGGYSENDSFCFLSLGTGFGAGIILNGALWEGPSFKAGEIGNMMLGNLDIDAPASMRWQRLEDRVNIKAIKNEFGIDLLREDVIDDAVRADIIRTISSRIIPAIMDVAFFLDINHFVFSGIIPEKLGGDFIDYCEHAINSTLEKNKSHVSISRPRSEYSALVGVSSLVSDKEIRKELQD